MKLDYRNIREAQEQFQWSDRWEIFDKDRAHLNIAHECIDRHPGGKIAIRIWKEDGSQEAYTFGELSRYTSQFANMLDSRGIKAGDRVGVVLSPSIGYYVSLFGILKRGAVAVPCYALLGPDGIEYRLRDAQAWAVIIGRERMGCVKPGLVSQVIDVGPEFIEGLSGESDVFEPDTSADALALIQFSSGTTGQPSQVPYHHSAASLTAVFMKLWIGLRSEDRYICTSSPAWGHGIWYGTVGPLIFGNGLCAYAGKFDPQEFLKVLQEFQITVISAIPRVYKMIMNCGKLDEYKLSLRRLTYSGGEIDKEVQRYFREKLGLHIASAYGNTEAGPIALDFAFDDWKPKVGSAGKAMIGVKLGILDDEGRELPPGKPGEVAVWRKGKWNKIGDSGCLDEEGYLYPLGRSDDVIKSSGFRIGPFEVETVLERHPAVQKSAVVGSPDEERGEVVKAFVVLKPEVRGTEELTKDIQNFVKTRLSMHEYPREIEFVQDIPETPDGKLRRKVLKQRECEKKRGYSI